MPWTAARLSPRANSLIKKEERKVCLKKNMNGSRPSEHPTQGGKMSKVVYAFPRAVPRGSVVGLKKEKVERRK